MSYILVSGACGGIGKQTALRLLKDGYSVVGVDIAKSDIDDPNFLFVQCDLCNKEQRASLKNQLIERNIKLCGIINVAGIFIMQSMIEGSEEELRRILEINFFAVYNLNKEMFDLLEKNSKIIILSSEVAKNSPQPFDGAYSMSKTILDNYADILRRELNYLSIKVIKVQPGAIRTGLLNGVNSRYEKMVENSKYYKSPLTKLKKLMDNEIKKQVSPIVIANVFAKILKKKHPKICYRVKNSFALSFLNFLPERLQDWIYLKVIK